MFVGFVAMTCEVWYIPTVRKYDFLPNLQSHSCCCQVIQGIHVCMYLWCHITCRMICQGTWETSLLFIYLSDCNQRQLGPALGTATSTAAATNVEVETYVPLDTAAWWVDALWQAERAFHSNSSAVFKLNDRNRKYKQLKLGFRQKISACLQRGVKFVFLKQTESYFFIFWLPFAVVCVRVEGRIAVAVVPLSPYSRVTPH